jgi:hypothetical protein
MHQFLALSSLPPRPQKELKTLKEVDRDPQRDSDVGPLIPDDPLVEKSLAGTKLKDNSSPFIDAV